MTSRNEDSERASEPGRKPKLKSQPQTSQSLRSRGGDKSRGVDSNVTADAPDTWFPAASRYKQLGPPTSGGMGVVYKALDVNLDIEVAVKRIRPEFVTNAELIKRFEREARTQVRLKHANLVQVRDYAVDEIGPYIVMDWIDGESLAQTVKDGPVEWKKAARIIGKCAMALHVAHEAGIIHRDIKPGNILLNASGEPFITDFGLVRIESQQSVSSETVTGALLGTVDYMAPEQLDDPRDASVQSDIWSLGATLYRLTTGKSVRGMRESSIPQPLLEVILRAMEEKPSERFRTMREFGVALRDALAGESKKVESPPVPSEDSWISNKHTLLVSQKPPSMNTAERILPRLSDRRQVTNRTRYCAICIYIIGSLSIGYRFYSLLYVILIFSSGNDFAPDPPGGLDPPIVDPYPENTTSLLVGVATVILLLMTDTTTLIGAYNLQTLKNYRFALIGAIIACIPFCGPLFVLGIPFGIWALVLLLDSDVQKAFIK